jgi:diguanylate cyclase (GGDEF)-like protein/PAS domain S-box-containing protein
MAPATLPPTRILLIDDDEEEYIITRDLLADAHNGLSFQLEWVATYEEALVAITDNRHDIYLVDYNLGAKSGIELLGEAVKHGVSAPMILLTGQGDPEVDSAATRAGAADYLVKGNLDTALLERAVRYAISRKRGEDRLRAAAAQNALLSAALANSDVGVMITGLKSSDYGITFVNSAFERITGYSAHEVIGKNPRFFQNRDPQLGFPMKMREALEALQPYQGTILNYRKGGSPFWNEMQISPVRSSEGDVIAWLGFVTDVTSKIEAENALRQSRESLAAAQRLTHLGSWVTEVRDLVDLQSNPTSWSDEVFRIFGLEPQSMQAGRELFLSFIHPEDLPDVEQSLVAIIDGALFDMECRIIRATREERIVRLRVEVQRDEAGRPVRALGTIHDITEHRQALEIARESRYRLHTLLENAPLIIWALDDQGRVEFIEGQAMQAAEIAAEDYLHQSIFDVPGMTEPSRELARRALAGEEANGIDEKNGVYFDIKYSTLRDEQGLVNGAVGVSIDITERRRAEQAFQRSQMQLQAVLQSAPVVIWATDINGIFTVSQGRALNSLSLQPGQAVGRSVFEMYGKDSPIAEAVRRALQGEEAHTTIEVDGRIFDMRYGPSRAEDGKVNGVVGVSYDITDRVHAQRERDESEERFARIVTNVPGMVYRFHRTLAGKMSFLYVSDGCRDVYGIGAEEALKDSHVLMEIIHPDDLAGYFESIFQSESSLEPWKWQGRILNFDGSERWIRGESRPARQSDGSTIWDGIVVDITESHKAQEEVLRSRAALSEAQRLAHIGSFEWDLASGKVIWSQEMYRIFGYTPGEFQPDYDSILEFIPPEMRPGDGRSNGETAARRRSSSVQIEITRRDGQKRILQTRTRAESDEKGHTIRLVGSAQDVTENVESQRALQESEERYALAARGANDGLWDWNLVEGRIYLSPRWKQMLGYAEDEVGTSPDEWFTRVHPTDIERVRSMLALHLAGESSHFECEYRLRCADGSYRWVLGRGLAVLGEDGQAKRIAGSQTDITDHKTAEAQLSHNAFYDTLTGLPNRALFLDRLEKTIARAKRDEEYTFAVLFLDIDRFKKINDSLGHLPGDQLLIEAARRFETCLRPGDTVARLGGDEFAILIDNIRDEEDVDLVAGRIGKELQTPISLEGHDIFVTVSIGVAPSKGGRERPDELLRNADTAMYRAKGLGRARHEIFDAAMHQSAVKMLELESDLWRALERNELCLHYQPIVDLSTGLINGYEALVRWQHPERGLVSPGDFIPLAEESGLIVPIGWWVLEQACCQARRWAEKYKRPEPHFMAVNLSSKQFSQGDMIEVVSEIVGRCGFNPHYLKLEITESVIMENTESANSMLLQLKQLGISLSMDDFGTGYSSLSYLHRFPLDTLKIDRSFVSHMSAHTKNSEIVGTILSLASGLSMNVVAEGVETAEQLETLREMGCASAQGYFFSRPLTAQGIEELLAREPLW